MNKKLVLTLLCVVVCALVPMQVFSQYASGNAIGASFHGDPTSAGVSVTGKFESIPLIFGGKLAFSSSNFGINITADSWMLHNQLGRVGLADVYLYLGPGADIGVVLGEVIGLDLGLRAPVGLSWMVDSPGWEQWEIFTEFTAGVNVIGGTIGQSNALFLFGYPLGQDSEFHVLNTFNFGFSLGFRYWL